MSYQVNLDFINRVTKLLCMVTVTALLKKLDLRLLSKSQSEEDLPEQGNYEDVKQYIN